MLAKMAAPAPCTHANVTLEARWRKVRGVEQQLTVMVADGQHNASQRCAAPLQRGEAQPCANAAQRCAALRYRGGVGCGADRYVTHVICASHGHPTMNARDFIISGLKHFKCAAHHYIIIYSHLMRKCVNHHFSSHVLRHSRQIAVR